MKCCITLLYEIIKWHFFPKPIYFLYTFFLQGRFWYLFQSRTNQEKKETRSSCCLSKGGEKEKEVRKGNPSFRNERSQFEASRRNRRGHKISQNCWVSTLFCMSIKATYHQMICFWWCALNYKYILLPVQSEVTRSACTVIWRVRKSGSDGQGMVGE